MSIYPTLREADLQGKKVLLRAGFDVPMENGVVTDISRIEAIIPTMNEILSRGAALIIIAHQDRPKGKVVPEMSQKPLVPILEKLLHRTVLFAHSCTGPEMKAMVDALTPGEVILLENLRFDAREEANDASFAAELAALADVYVNDAFSNSHRSHASMVGVAQKIPSFMGLQLEQEVQHLSLIVDHPPHPLTLIVSGAKIETKLPVIEFFLHSGDAILVGGAIANTFIVASGFPAGKSLYEGDFVSKAQQLMRQSGAAGIAHISVPQDAVAATGPKDSPQSIALTDLTDQLAVYDIGPKTVAAYADIISRSGAVVWNGPLGMYEEESFAAGSIGIADALHKAALAGVKVIVGGGDTIDFHTRYSLDMSSYTFVSTGGGAMLDFVSGKTLPALDVLRSRA